MGDARAAAMPPPGAHEGAAPPRRHDMSWPDYLAMLLHIAAEIEHALMVQYLYAGWSLGGEAVPEGRRATVAAWRKSVLAVAKEEMGHLLTVQNLLTALGLPTNLSRSDFPWDSPYYPFDFRLEPLSLGAMACFVVAEMPPELGMERGPGRRRASRYSTFDDAEIRRIVDQARTHTGGGALHPVATVYGAIIEIIADPAKIPDSAFRSETYAHQAAWDDWGRNYHPDPYALDAEGNRLTPEHDHAEDYLPASSREAVVLIDRIATRTQALEALRALAAQGEATHLGLHDTGEPSHFERFLEVYQGMEQAEAEGWAYARPLAANPTVVDRADIGNAGDYLADPATRAWGELFNLRYRMLLGWLKHVFRLARITPLGTPNLRGMAMHRVFAEMYNLKAIAALLMEMPAGCDEAHRAGPPFELPFTLELPVGEADVWSLHRLLYTEAIRQEEALLEAAGERRAYLESLLLLDRRALAWVEGILAGSLGR